MNDKISNASVATILVAAVVLIVAVAGAVVTIVNPDTLNFKDYIDALAIAGAGGGLLGIGRGILGGAKQPGGFGPSPIDVAEQVVMTGPQPGSLTAPADPPEGSETLGLNHPEG